MASEAIKRLIFKQMFEQGAAQAKAKKIADMAPELVGSQAQDAQPEIQSQYQQSPQEMFPGEQPLPGLMNIDQQAQPAQAATGLFDMDTPFPERNVAFNQRLMSSGMPSLQRQGLKNLSAMRDQTKGRSGNQAFQPVTLINPTTGEKMLVSPNVNRQTGEANLSPFDIPQGFEVSTETADEKRQGDLGVLGDRKRLEIESANKAKRQQGWITEGLTSAEALPNINRGIDLLNSVETGGIDKVSLMAKQLFGVEGADEAELSNRLGKAVLSQLRETFGAAFTAAEGKQLERIEAGFGKSTKGNKRLLNQLKSMLERKTKRAIRVAENLGDIETAQQLKEMLNIRITDEGETSAKPKSVTDAADSILGL